MELLKLIGYLAAVSALALAAAAFIREGMGDGKK